MIKLPSNWLKQIRVREFPHDPAQAVLLVTFRNQHDQVANLYWSLQGTHGLRAADKLEEALLSMARIDLSNMDPFINGTNRETGPARDQDWDPIVLPNTINLKDYRAKHGLKDPEEAKRA